MTLSAAKIKQRLTTLAKERGEPFHRLQTLFFLERAALRLSGDPILSRHLVFKGGFVSVKAYGSPRFTKDLDASLHGLSVEKARQKVIDVLTADANDSVWFTFEGIESAVHQSDYGGVRFIFRAGFTGETTTVERAQIVHVDIGTGDPITPGERLIQTISPIDQQTLSWLIYPPETIIAEKLHTLIALGSLNSRSKDIYDISLLCKQADPLVLSSAISATFGYRKEERPKSFAGALADIDRSLLRRGWKTAAGYLRDAPDFDQTFDAIIAWLRKNNL